MQLSKLLASFAGLCAVVSAQMGTQDPSAQITLDTKGRSGLLPAKLEDAIIDSLGPRFANGLYASDPASNSLSSCLSCAWPLISDLPCLYQSMRTNDMAAMSRCGVRNEEICNCVACVPALVQPHIQKFCAGSANSAAPTTENVSTAFAQSGDPSVKAFLGSATTVDIDAAKFHIFGSVAHPKSANGERLCQSCQECRCCVGVGTSDGPCIGSCIY